jgi:hypothetical protein
LYSAMDILSSIFGGGENKELEYLRVTGNYDFHIHPEVAGVLPYHTCSVAIKVYRDSSKLAQLDFDCEWYRIIEGRCYPIEDNEEEFYVFNPYDIGASIKAVVTVEDQRSSGVAEVVFGPIKMDPSLRPHVKETVLHHGGEFDIRIIGIDEELIDDNSNYTSKLILKTSDLVFSIVAQEGQLEAQQIKVAFENSIAFRVECDTHDDRAMEVFFDEGDLERSVKVQFVSRAARDLFILAMRIIKILRISCITDMVNSYGQILNKQWVPKRLNTDDGDEYFQRFKEDGEMLRSALKMIIEANKTLTHDNEKLEDAIEHLEHDLESSIAEFSKLLQQVQERGPIDLQQFEEKSRIIGKDSSVLLDKLRNDPTSNFQSKKSSKDENVHERKLEELRQINQIKTQIEEQKKLKKMLEDELAKSRGGVRGPSSDFMANNLSRSEVGFGKKKQHEDEEDAVEMSLDNVLADLEVVDYKKYKIADEEIELYKETMKLRLAFSEEKRSHETLKSNMEFISQLRKTCIERPGTIDISNLTLPEEAESAAIQKNPAALARLLAGILQENKMLAQKCMECNKAHLLEEQSSQELVKLRLQYLLKKNTSLDDQTEKAEEELGAKIVERFQQLEQLKSSTVSSATFGGQATSVSKAPIVKPEGPSKKKEIEELQERIRLIQQQNAIKAKKVEEEKARIPVIKSELEKALAEKKTLQEKAERVKQLQAEMGELVKKMEQLGGEATDGGAETAEDKKTLTPDEDVFASGMDRDSLLLDSHLEPKEPNKAVASTALNAEPIGKPVGETIPPNLEMKKKAEPVEESAN